MFLISQLLRVKQETLLAALTAKRAKASGETLVINYKLPEVIYLFFLYLHFQTTFFFLNIIGHSS